MDCGIDAQNEAADPSEFKLEQDPAGATFQLKSLINDRTYSTGDNTSSVGGGQTPGCHFLTQVGIPTRPRSHWNGVRTGRTVLRTAHYHCIQPAITGSRRQALHLLARIVGSIADGPVWVW